MDRPEQSKETYDSIYADGGYQGVYDLPYRHSSYFPLFKQVLQTLVRRGVKSVLEVGCGTGGFAHLVMDKSRLSYHGFDFSPMAVKKATARTGRADAFYVGDATAHSSYEKFEYDCIVCTEVLEHIKQDLEAIEQWKAGTYCVCSVPNFDSETHERFFRSEDEVRARYGKLIDIQDVVRVKKPVLSDISTSNVLRALRWNRYRPKRLLGILGLGSFDAVGGWFVFSGARRT